MTSGKGWFFYTLNVLRIISILSMVYSVIAGLCCIVKMFQTSNFTFFTFANMILTILFLIMFITIELEFFKNYLVRNWPAFSSTSTFTVLACGQIIVGFQILEMVTRSDYRNTVVGGAMYGIGISAGCLLVTIGWLYIIISIWSSIHYNELYIKAIRSCGTSSAQSKNNNLPIGASCTSYRTGTASVYAPSALSFQCIGLKHNDSRTSNHINPHTNASGLNYSSSTRSSARSNHSRYTYDTTASSASSKAGSGGHWTVRRAAGTNPVGQTVEYMNSMDMLNNIIHDTPSQGIVVIDNGTSPTKTTTNGPAAPTTTPTSTAVVTPPPFSVRKVNVDGDDEGIGSGGGWDRRAGRMREVRRGGASPGAASSIYSVPSYYTNFTDVDLRSPSSFEVQKPKGL